MNDPQDVDSGWYSMTWIAMEAYPNDLHVLIRRLHTLGKASWHPITRLYHDGKRADLDFEFPLDEDVLCTIRWDDAGMDLTLFTLRSVDSENGISQLVVRGNHYATVAGAMGLAMAHLISNGAQFVGTIGWRQRD